MGSLMKKQAERFLREKKRHRRWLAMFLCLALVVTSGTFAALRMNGHAMDHGGKILNCRLRVHAHSDECFDGEGKMICGQADYAVHTHDARCHNDEGELVCQLPEREAHVHDSACYAEEKVLTCKEEETAGHQHSPECYIEEPGELVCSLPEHEHSELCYDELGNLVCGQEAHYHDNSCYAVNEVLICGQEEGQGGHAHTDACYETQKKLTCKELELHTHDRENCYDANGNLTCGKLELQEHEHGEGCFEDEEIPGMDIENEEFLADGEPEKNAPEESASDNAKDPSEEQAAENSVSGDSVSQDAVSENSVSENGVSENSVSENSVSDNSVSENSISENSVSGNGVSENSVSKNSVSENNITLETKVDGITISLSGPESSFDTDKELSIQAKKVKDDEQIEAIEKAVDKLAEKKDKEVKDYQAFDITLLADGKEVQPLGPVEVKFSGKKVEKAVENKKTDVEVLHVGEETEKPKGEKKDDTEKKEVVIETKGFSVQDMKATATEEKEVVIETEHFSVYVYVNLADITGAIKVTVQHWGQQVETINGEADASEGKDTVLKQYPDTVKDENGFPKAEIQKKYEDREIYSADPLTVPNEYYDNLTALSKLCNVTPEDAKNYTVTKVWVSNDKFNKTYEERAAWPNGTYTEYSAAELNDKTSKKEVKISEPSFIRFWYKPKDKTHDFDVTFYDYDITDGNWGSEEQGINSPNNYSSSETKDRLGVGQSSMGNLSSWASTAAIQMGIDEGRTLNQQTKLTLPTGKEKLITEEIVQKKLDENGELQFNVTAPKNLFSENIGGGSKQYDNYKLGFTQKGDTYTLDYVLDTKEGKNVEENLSKMTYMQHAYKKPNVWIFSNNFWPLDNVPDVANGGHRKDELIGQYGADGKPQKFPFKKKDGSVDAKGIENDDQQNYHSTITTGHNYYFGMRYSVDFTIGDYTGPMEYYFRGDDDFWLFIDDTLVVDIGGIHQVASESVDLRAKMVEEGLITYKDGKLQDKDKTHTMKIFYMERGATGSCCYMQFSVPNSKPVPIKPPETKTYEVKKVWNDNGNPFQPGEVTVELQQILNGKSTATGKKVTLKAPKWSYEWKDLPKIQGSSKEKYEYSYSVEEISLPPGYESSVDPETGQLTNSLKPVKVEVEKAWENDSGLEAYRKPITLQLYANGKLYKDTYNDGKTEQARTITLSVNNKWKGVFESLPEYWDYELGSDGKYTAKKVIYSVKELDAKGNPIESDGYLTTTDGAKYQVTYSGQDTSTPTPTTEPTAADQGMPGPGAGDDDFVNEEGSPEDQGTDDSGNTGIVEDDEVDDDSGNIEIGSDGNTLTDTAQGDTAEDGFDAEVNGPVGDEINGNSPAGDETIASPDAVTPPSVNDIKGENKGVAASLTVTNTLVKNFKIAKKSSVSENNVYTPLEGAGFTLTLCDANGVVVGGGEVQTITSGKGGTMQLDLAQLEVGKHYLLEETKAPAGYMLSRTRWIIHIVENFGMKEIGEVKSFEDYSDQPDVPNTVPVTESFVPDTTGDELVLTYTFYNDEIYQLPETGGIGTYWYTISGMLLMMGASLILYKNRRRQAVRR